MSMWEIVKWTTVDLLHDPTLPLISSQQVCFILIQYVLIIFFHFPQLFQDIPPLSPHQVFLLQRQSFSVSIAFLLTIARKWEEIKYPSTDEQIMTMIYTNTMELY